MELFNDIVTYDEGRLILINRKIKDNIRTQRGYHFSSGHESNCLYQNHLIFLDIFNSLYYQQQHFYEIIMDGFTHIVSYSWGGGKQFPIYSVENNV